MVELLLQLPFIDIEPTEKQRDAIATVIGMVLRRYPALLKLSQSGMFPK
jgi:hypothetical protein